MNRHGSWRRESVTRRLRALALVVWSTAAAGCSGSGGGALGSIVSPLQVVYMLERDSSGTAPQKDAELFLVFLPESKASFVAVTSTDGLAHQGSWTLEAGQMHLRFGSSDFHPDATFALDLNQAEVTMPFQVFSTGGGSSLWRQVELSYAQGMQLAMESVPLDPDLKGGPAGGIDRAYQYAQARLAVDPQDVSGPSARPTSDASAPASSSQPSSTGAATSTSTPADTGGSTSSVTTEAPSTSGTTSDTASTPDTSTDSSTDTQTASSPQAALPRSGRVRLDAATLPRITGLTQTKDGVDIRYADGHSATVALWTWNAPPNNATPLRPGPLAGDPRAHLNDAPPGIPVSDPPQKTALIVSPYDHDQTFGFADLTNSNGTIVHITDSWDFSGAEDALKAAGYQYTYLGSTHLAGHKYVGTNAATLVNILTALGASSRSAPGFIAFATHGLDNGGLTTADYLGVSGTEADAFKEVEQQLKDAGYGAAITFDGGTEAAPKTFGVSFMARDLRPDTLDVHVTLLPQMWTWLAGRGVDLTHSFVYLGACLVDQSKDLRNDLRARALIDYSEEADPVLAGTVFNYLVAELIRPTFTAEEAYYNLIRVAHTRQEVYQEDHLLDGVVQKTAPDNPKTDLFAYMHGYGWDGSAAVPYDGTGWLDRAHNQGQIWWMVFSARWGEDVRQGVKNLVDCWNGYWTKPRSEITTTCTQWDTGTNPTQDEVGYATYLLVGRPVIAYSGRLVPRFTLNDGRTGQ